MPRLQRQGRVSRSLGRRTQVISVQTVHYMYYPGKEWDQTWYLAGIVVVYRDDGRMMSRAISAQYQESCGRNIPADLETWILSWLVMVYPSRSCMFYEHSVEVVAGASH